MIHQQDVEPIPVIKILAYLFEISMILKVSSSEISVASQSGEYKCVFFMNPPEILLVIFKI